MVSQGTVTPQKYPVQPKPVPQSSLHQAIYKARADVKAVFHFHSPAVILLSVVGQTIRPMHNYSAIFYEGVPLYNGTGQVESPARAGEMAKLLGSAKALMLRGHGAVVVGQSIREVCMLALFLEESARLQAEATNLKSDESAPKWVSVTHYGWRIPFISIYPNAVSIRQVAGPDVSIIPWVNIVILSFLAFAAFEIFLGAGGTSSSWTRATTSRCRCP